MRHYFLCAAIISIALMTAVPVCASETAIGDRTETTINSLIFLIDAGAVSTNNDITSQDVAELITAYAQEMILYNSFTAIGEESKSVFIKVLTFYEEKGDNKKAVLKDTRTFDDIFTSEDASAKITDYIVNLVDELKADPIEYSANSNDYSALPGVLDINGEVGKQIAEDAKTRSTSAHRTELVLLTRSLNPNARTPDFTKNAEDFAKHLYENNTKFRVISLSDEKANVDFERKITSLANADNDSGESASVYHYKDISDAKLYIRSCFTYSLVFSVNKEINEKADENNDFLFAQGTNGLNLRARLFERGGNYVVTDSDTYSKLLGTALVRRDGDTGYRKSEFEVAKRTGNEYRLLFTLQTPGVYELFAQINYNGSITESNHVKLFFVPFDRFDLRLSSATDAETVEAFSPSDKPVGKVTANEGTDYMIELYPITTVQTSDKTYQTQTLDLPNNGDITYECFASISKITNGVATLIKDEVPFVRQGDHFELSYNFKNGNGEYLVQPTLKVSSGKGAFEPYSFVEEIEPLNIAVHLSVIEILTVILIFVIALVIVSTPIVWAVRRPFRIKNSAKVTVAFSGATFYTFALCPNHSKIFYTTSAKLKNIINANSIDVKDKDLFRNLKTKDIKFVGKKKGVVFKWANKDGFTLYKNGIEITGEDLDKIVLEKGNTLKISDTVKGELATFSYLE